MFCEFADFVGDDGETAAGFAGAGGFDGGVEGEQVGLFRDVVDGVDDAADLFGFGGQAEHGGADLGAGVGDLADGVGGLRGLDAFLGDAAGLFGGFGGGGRRLGGGAAALAASWDGLAGGFDHPDLTSAPWATSLTAEAISPTARPASSEVDAICSDADATVPAPSATSASTSLSCVRMVP